jgi:hypothetical protein
MLLKKLKHVTLEKFCVKSESNGWGKGVGRTGGVAGIVGIGWVLVDVEDEELPAEDGELPAEDGELPAEDGELPAEDGEIPPDDGTLPEDREPTVLGGGPAVEGDQDERVVVGGTISHSSAGCRLCCLQEVSPALTVGQSKEGREPEKISKMMGCVRKRLEAVIRMTAKGTRRTVHFVLRPNRRFFSLGDAGGGVTEILMDSDLTP